MTVALHGLGVSRGIAVGCVVVFMRDELQVTEYSLTENDIPWEIERYRGALQQVQVHLRSLRERFISTTPIDFASLITDFRAGLIATFFGAAYGTNYLNSRIKFA